jgi:hypothetical protein
MIHLTDNENDQMDHETKRFHQEEINGVNCSFLTPRAFFCRYAFIPEIFIT